MINKYLFFIIVVLILIVISLTYCTFSKNDSATSTTITEYDTIIKWDTLLIEKPKFVTKTKIDTQYIVIIEKDSIVALKASRGMKFENITEKILEKYKSL